MSAVTILYKDNMSTSLKIDNSEGVQVCIIYFKFTLHSVGALVPILILSCKIV